MPISMLKYIKHSDMFRSPQITMREYVCTSLNLLNYLKTLNLKSWRSYPVLWQQNV